MSPIVDGRYVEPPSPLPDLKPYPDPLAAFTGPLRLLRLLLRLLGVAVVLLLLAALALFAGWIFGTIASTGTPILPNGEVVGDKLDIYLSFRDSGLRDAVISLGLALGIAGLIYGLVRVGTIWVRDSGDAMVADYVRRRTKATLQAISTPTTPAAPGRRSSRRFLRRTAYALALAAAAIAAWLALSYVLQLDPVRDSPAGYLARAIGVALLLAFGLYAVVLMAFPVVGLIQAGDYVVRHLVGPLGITSERVDEIQDAGEREALAVALRAWPPHSGTPLRLDAAVSVLAAPPSVEGSDRALDVPWSGSRTGIEILAGTLLAAATLECRERGMVELVAGDVPQIRSRIPDDALPEGLALIVLGHHRVGFDPGRLVNGSPERAAATWLPRGDEDPHWLVIEVALADLDAAGVCVHGDVDPVRLAAAVRRVPERYALETLKQDQGELLRVLTEYWRKGLGKLRTVESGEGAIRKSIALVVNRHERTSRHLPNTTGSTGPGMGSLSTAAPGHGADGVRSGAEHHPAGNTASGSTVPLQATDDG